MKPQAHTTSASTWRVRTWIRAAAVLVFVFLCSEQWDVVRRVGLGQMPREEIRNGYVLLAVYAVGMVLRGRLGRRLRRVTAGRSEG